MAWSLTPLAKIYIGSKLLKRFISSGFMTVTDLAARLTAVERMALTIVPILTTAKLASRVSATSARPNIVGRMKPKHGVAPSAPGRDRVPKGTSGNDHTPSASGREMTSPSPPPFRVNRHGRIIEKCEAVVELRWARFRSCRRRLGPLCRDSGETPVRPLFRDNARGACNRLLPCPLR